MLLTLTCTAPPARDLGFVLKKHPDHVRRYELAFGTAHVFWPEATDERATCALYVEVDPVYLARRSHPDDPRPLEPYVNDRPYVGSSFLSVAMGAAFRSAMAGRATERPDLVDQALPLEVRLPALRVRGGVDVVRDLFEPLGYEVEVELHEHRILGLVLRHRLPVRAVLGHLYVLVPVLDDEKHYWVGDDEVEKLLHHGDGWLEEHPRRELIARRYLKRAPALARAALARLATDEPAPPDAPDDDEQELEQRIADPVPLNELRYRFVVQVLKDTGSKSAIDLGCGDGKLLKRLITDKHLARVGGVDVSGRALEIADRRLDLGKLPGAIRDKLSLFQGSLTYRDRRLQGWDLGIALEVIEHLEPHRIGAFEDAVLGFAAPGHLILTTPNAEYNARFQDPTRFRHPDHRFEWTRPEFRAWVERVSERYGYDAVLHDLGHIDPALGPPTQAVVWTRRLA